MFRNLIEEFKRHRQKHSFHEYGFETRKIELTREGTIDYARWLHPFYDTDDITQDRVDFYRQFVRPGETVIDIGAHEGDTAVPMALAATPTGLVIAIEPNPHVFPVLEANSKFNPDKTKILPLNFAATAEDGDFVFGSGDAAFGNGGIIGFSTNTAKNNRYTFNVKGRNIEAYLKANHLDALKKLSLIKIDTEGYDKEILKNISGILSEYQPFVISECFKQLKKDERDELYDALARHGYSIYYLPEFRPKAQQLISKEQMDDRKHFDILAIPKGKTPF